MKENSSNYDQKDLLAIKWGFIDDVEYKLLDLVCNRNRSYTFSV